MSIIFSILYFLIMLVVIFGLYMLCKKFIFSKVRVNKYIPLAISVILLLLQMSGLIKNHWFSIIITPVIVILFLWFMDILQTGGPKKGEKKIVIKSKAKPNRAKNLKK